MRPLFSLVCFSVSAVVASAAPSAEEIISKARAKLGAEVDLSGVKKLTIVGKGTVVREDTKDEKNEFVVQFDYMEPGKRREYTLANNTTVERIIASNGLEGFEKYVNLNGQPQQQRISPLSSASVKHNLDLYYADTGFYSTPPNGKVTYEGIQTVRNKTCHTLQYRYGNGTIFKRYFDTQTFVCIAADQYQEKDPANYRRQVDEGEFLASTKETDSKTGKTTEKPSRPGGILFPKTSIIYDKDGKEISRVEYTDVSVNGIIPDSVFAYPMP
jgi:outer membrane lipoprotein-sorting protein